ncbi:MAG: hypothetical protein K8T10_10370 [Candidatus Eremiobacteraeota bacterium]|nr:hypothetical protein [Candidatus Eremiobacteraeota bacterium]
MKQGKMLLILFILLISFTFGYGGGKAVNAMGRNKVKNSQLQDKVEKDDKAIGKIAKKTGKASKKEYRILYLKYSNVIKSAGGRKSFSIYDFPGGGIITLNGKNNNNLKFKGYLMGRPDSMKYDRYFYISASGSPISQQYGYYFFNFDYPNQDVWYAGVKNKKSTKIKGAGKKRFPSDLAVSPGNKYLAYLMTKKKEKKGGLIALDRFNPFITDTYMVIRNMKTGNEKEILKGKYNRQLLKSFLHFSGKGDALYTIIREGNSFKFVKLTLETGKITEFKSAFPSFDWSKTKWELFFRKKDNISAKFFMSPDESMIVAFKNYCDRGKSSYKIWAFDIKNGSFKKYEDAPGFIQGLTWKNDSKRFAYILLTKCTCFPGYVDSSIYKMDRDGKNKKTLVFEKERKINSLGWSPDGKEIVFCDYGLDFVGYIKSVDPETNKVRNIANMKDIDGKVDQEKPVIPSFLNWITVQSGD